MPTNVVTHLTWFFSSERLPSSSYGLFLVNPRPGSWPYPMVCRWDNNTGCFKQADTGVPVPANTTVSWALLDISPLDIS